MEGKVVVRVATDRVLLNEVPFMKRIVDDGRLLHQ
jgi:hypothetical protein